MSKAWTRARFHVHAHNPLVRRRHALPHLVWVVLTTIGRPLAIDDQTTVSVVGLRCVYPYLVHELRCDVVFALLVVDGVSMLFEWIRFFLADLFLLRGGDDLDDVPKLEYLLAPFFCGVELTDRVLCFDFNLGDDVLSLELVAPFADVPLFFEFETLL